MVSKLWAAAWRGGGVAWGVAAVVLFACQGGGARLEVHTETGWEQRPVVEVVASGRRDGYRTEATVQVVRPDDRPITLTLTIAVDPTAHLVSGQWQEAGRGGGTVTPLRLDFLGGQGEGGSVGGRYLLEDDGGERYRVTLPPTLLRAGWGGVTALPGGGDG
ncbi:MAG: hypothetical protein COW73_07985 [Nitrospirae bacterium CG18_big_fil_WC_8_21_14_2_50_70_55]|nr:hypothetical protein [Deltaproteobacteria bacterium]NCP95625.1 hypothetical protein [Deltaproteobacteria bacterium]NCS74346.1 hypothetical protein [Deltaproteobacteria bacterium]PIQ04372.1 MAG: hypothetical protein COW73_07985 [Nitrospirae bacterium CG18_big_fil_WC_8_21_14_2_50_70_55]PIX83770.1 MAG: hypothetical protein COZ33_03720 [Nitrospirae bacterium CG_4_10_14_3_um_filter_70_108]